MAYKVLFDGNDSGIIQVVGCGAYVPLAKYQALTEELTALATEVDEANDRIGELVAESQASLELLSIVTEERDFLITFIDKNASLLNEIDELKAQLVAVKEGGGTGQSPCAKFCESVALRKDFDQLREYADQVKVDRDALAAQVELMRLEFNDARKTLQFIAGCGHDSTDKEVADAVLIESRLWISRYDDSCFRLNPQQHLAEIKADAVKAFADEIGVFSREYDDQGYVEVAIWKVQEHIAKIRNTGTWLKDSNVNGGKRQGGAE